MKRWYTREAALRLLLLAALAGICVEGFLNTPEGASNLTPLRFYATQIKSSEKVVVSQEQELDFYRAANMAVRVRLEELRRGVYVPAPGSLVTEESLLRALRKDQATLAWAEDRLVRAREKKERAKRLGASGWRMGFACAPFSEDRP
ncbi:MAG: hypothetical protein AB9872_13635 [Solidesulfovibrio sp.]